MSVPFRLDPESSKRPAHQDPFLEFESERPAPSSLLKSQDALRPPVIPPALPQSLVERHESAINPSLAFALGVAGLVTAAVGYYQMAQVLATRAQTPAQTGAAAPAPPVKPVGRLEIVSEPAGAAVKVDGVPLGITPLTLDEVPSGRHEVVITRGASSVTRVVELQSGSAAVVTAVLGAAPLPSAPLPGEAPPPGGSPGWITLDTPIELRILERGRPRGTTSSGRVSLAEGSHELEFVNDLYEVRHTIQTTVVAGRGTRVNIPLPSGSLSINADPWADVWVNGTAVGTTPLANVSLPIGTHQVVLRHPTLGERKHTVLVKAITPARLGVTMR